MERPAFLKKGEPARLFPVLADSSKEGRALSIFLACFAHVPEFGRALMTSLGQRSGTRTRFRVFTEVEFASNGGKNNRPDGILIVENGRSSWSALIEAKIGNAELTAEQLTAYCEIAKANGIDAIITISNQFAPLTTHHPLKLPASVRKKVEIFHWSWTYLLTQASLLVENEEIGDETRHILTQEFIRFLSHESTGAKSFTSMPRDWSEIAAKIHAGGAVKQSAEEVKEIVRLTSTVLGAPSPLRHFGTECTRSEATDPMEKTSYNFRNGIIKTQRAGLNYLGLLFSSFGLLKCNQKAAV